jgi:hypothetical protein
MHENVHESDSQRNVRVDSKRDEYTKDRFAWFDQVAADAGLPASAFKVAYAIATGLWRSKGTVTLVSPQAGATDKVREAWIGTRDIADKIAMSRFTVMDMVDRLEARGHLQVTRGHRGRGHSNHYRLVGKGAPANLSKHKQTKLKGAHSSLLGGAEAKPKAKPRGAPANLLDGEKVSPRTSRGAPTHLNPFVPSEEPSEKGGAHQARPGADSFEGFINSPLGATTTDDDESGVAWAPPPKPLQSGVEGQWGFVIDQHGNPLPPPECRSDPGRKSNRERGLQSFGGGL